MENLNFNVQDPSYQANEEFKPDKAHLWKIPPEKTGWVLAHNAIREEISSFLHALEKINSTLKKNQIIAIEKWWKGHSIHIYEHHSNEDQYFNPFIRQRINYPEKLESDHNDLIDHMEAIDQEISNLSENNNIEQLLKLWREYSDIMLPHLLEEETIGLPLVMAYFTPKEVSEVTSEFAKKGDKCAIGSFIHWMGSKKNCMEFMRHEGIPWFVWYIPCGGFKTNRNYYRNTMIKQINILNKSS